MFKAMPRAATRESRPTIKPRPPKNSAAIARIANNAGICMVFVKKPMVPLKPSPPNQPNIFCAPCAKNTTPSANRRIAVAASFSVEMSFRNIVPPVLSILLYAPFHEDSSNRPFPRRRPRSNGSAREPSGPHVAGGGETAFEPHGLCSPKGVPSDLEPWARGSERVQRREGRSAATDAASAAKVLGPAIARNRGFVAQQEVAGMRWSERRFERPQTRNRRRTHYRLHRGVFQKRSPARNRQRRA